MYFVVKKYLPSVSKTPNKNDVKKKIPEWRQGLFFKKAHSLT